MASRVKVNYKKERKRRETYTSPMQTAQTCVSLDSQLYLLKVVHTQASPAGGVSLVIISAVVMDDDSAAEGAAVSSTITSKGYGSEGSEPPPF